MDWIGLALNFIGAILNTRKIIWCWPVWILANTAWVVYWWPKQEYAMLLLMGMFTCLNIYGWWHWTRPVKGCPNCGFRGA
jgi:nicotinamide mononucleotide transporter